MPRKRAVNLSHCGNASHVVSFLLDVVGEIGVELPPKDKWVKMFITTEGNL